MSPIELHQIFTAHVEEKWGEGEGYVRSFHASVRVGDVEIFAQIYCDPYCDDHGGHHGYAYDAGDAHTYLLDAFGQRLAKVLKEQAEEEKGP